MGAPPDLAPARRPVRVRRAGDAHGAPRRRHSPATLFLWLALLLYPAYALVTPPFQTPDEHQHLFRAWQLSRLQLLAERRDGRAGGEVPAAYVRAAGAELDLSSDHVLVRTITERRISEMLGRSTLVVPGEAPVFHTNAALYSPVGYVPQVLAIWIGDAAGASVENVVRLGRLLNAALAVALIAWSLRVLPVARLPVLVVALLPMTAASVASFGQDALAIGAAFLLTALGVRASLGGRWTRGALAVATVAGAAVTLAKIVYVPLLAVAAWPVPPRARRREWLSLHAVPIAVALALLAAWLWAVRGLGAPAKPELPTWGEQWGFVLAHPLYAFAATARAVFSSLVAKEVVGRFGWLNVEPSVIALVFAPVALLAALLAGDERARELGWRRRAWWLALVVAAAFAAAFVMYLVFTPLGAPVAAGMQGRYLLPVLPLALVACVPAVRRLPGCLRAEAVVVAAMLLANAGSLLTIGQAYYRK